MKNLNRLDFYYEEPEELEHEVLLPREVMDYLACGRSTFYKLVNSGELPAFRVGKMWRVSKDALEQFSHRN